MRLHDEQDKESKTNHVGRICSTVPSDFYTHAYERWRNVGDDPSRFRQVPVSLRNRMFIGLTGGGALETGCAIHHTYGTPYIPGSSVKGIVSAHARERLSDKSGQDWCDELFGRMPQSADNASSAQSGLVSFHDAWWVPNSADLPLVQEVVTTHHLDYYGKDGATPATDFDSPVPNAQIAVQGAFLFTIEGPEEWLDLVNQMLVSALTERGAGAKTRTGYGRFRAPEARSGPETQWAENWLRERLPESPFQRDSALRGTGLAQEWSTIEEPDRKSAVRELICHLWEERVPGSWENPKGRATRRARAMYDE